MNWPHKKSLWLTALRLWPPTEMGPPEHFVKKLRDVLNAQQLDKAEDLYDREELMDGAPAASENFDAQTGAS